MSDDPEPPKQVSIRDNEEEHEEQAEKMKTVSVQRSSHLEPFCQMGLPCNFCRQRYSDCCDFQL